MVCEEPEVVDHHRVALQVPSRPEAAGAISGLPAMYGCSTSSPDPKPGDEPQIPLIIEAHLSLPAYATRGHWHIVQGIAGTQYGLTPFCVISLFFQRGTRIDCGFVAVQSSMMITEQELGGRPLGVLDIMGNAVRAFLDCPWVRELDLRVTARRDMGKRFQEWMEGIHVGGLDVSGDSCGSRSRRTVPVIHSKTSLSGLESYLAPIGATVGSARPVVLTTVEDLGVALSAARKVASH